MFLGAKPGRGGREHIVLRVPTLVNQWRWRGAAEHGPPVSVSGRCSPPTPHERVVLRDHVHVRAPGNKKEARPDPSSTV